MLKQRVKRLRDKLDDIGLEALLVTDIRNVRYLSGFTGSAARLIITADQGYLLTDGRYTTQAADEASDFLIRMHQADWTGTLQEVLDDTKTFKLGFESHALSYADWAHIHSYLSSKELIPTSDLISHLRFIKDETEIAAIREAARITDLAFDHIVSILTPGLTERDAALEIDFFMRKCGADKEGFDTIVASGLRSALPHVKPTDSPITSREFITMDFGARWHGYHADITRTILLGEADSEKEAIWHTVMDAQTKAIDAIKPGISGKEIDRIAREHIVSKGFGDFFTHGLGHGLGLEVHEGRILSQESDIILQEGMVVTVEPGIYISGKGGVRIEDDILVTNTGSEILTHAPRFLILK